MGAFAPGEGIVLTSLKSSGPVLVLLQVTQRSTARIQKHKGLNSSE